MQNQLVMSACGALMLSPLLTSCDSSSIPGIKNFTLAVQKNRLYASFVAQSININEGMTIPFPEVPGATIGVNPYLDTTGQGKGGTVIQFDVDLTQLKGKNFSVAGLPDGRDLPDVEGGVLPRWAFSIKNVDVYAYLADGAFAVFFPINLVSPQGYGLPSMISKEIDDERGNMLGKVYAIPAQGSKTTSGLLILVSFVKPGISN